MAMRTRYGHHVSHRDETMGNERDKDEVKESSAAANVDITVKQQREKGREGGGDRRTLLWSKDFCSRRFFVYLSTVDIHSYRRESNVVVHVGRNNL